MWVASSVQSVYDKFELVKSQGLRKEIYPDPVHYHRRLAQSFPFYVVALKPMKKGWAVAPPNIISRLKYADMKIRIIIKKRFVQFGEGIIQKVQRIVKRAVAGTLFRFEASQNHFMKRRLLCKSMRDFGTSLSHAATSLTCLFSTSVRFGSAKKLSS